MISIKYDYNFIAGVRSNEFNFLNDYKIELHLVIDDISEYDQRVAFARIDYLMYNIIDNAIFIPDNDDIGLMIDISEIGYVPISLPSETIVDQIIQVVLVNKLNLLLDDKVQIFESDISSLRGGYVKYSYKLFDDDIEYDKKILGYDTAKWWNNNSPLYYNKDNNAKIIDFNEARSWKLLDLSWESDIDTDDKHDIPAHNNIIRVDFNA